MTKQVKQRRQQHQSRARAAHAAAAALAARTGREQFTFVCESGHHWVDDENASRHHGRCPRCGDCMI